MDLTFGFSNGYDFFAQGQLNTLKNKISTNAKGRSLVENKKKQKQERLE
jgi:hypothetical protein